MSDFITPLSPEYTIFLPEDILTWFFYAAWFLSVFAFSILLRDRKVSIDRRTLSWLAVLSALVLLLTPFLGVRIYPEVTVTEFSLPVNHLMVFAAVPWMVAVGILGVAPASMIAGISGILLAYLDTHQIATPLLFMTVSIIFSQIIRQNRSTGLDRFIQFPAVGAILALLFSTPVVFFSLMLSATGPIGLRFAFAINFFSHVFLALGGMVLMGGLIATVIWVFLPRVWQHDRVGDRAEENHFTRQLIAQMGLLMFVLVSILVVSVWRTAENTVRGILVEEMTDNAGMAADGVVIFVDTGKSQIEDLAVNDQLATLETEVLSQRLVQLSRSQSYFNLLAVFNTQGEIISSYSNLDGAEILPTPEESLAIGRAKNRMSVEIMVVPPILESKAAQASFIMPIPDTTGQAVRVLLGRSSLDDNPIAAFFLNALENLEDKGGTAQIINEQGMRLYHSNPALIMTDYTNPRFSTTTFFESTMLDNESAMMFYQPSGQSGWDIITAFPADVRHLMTWEIAYPQFLIGISGLLILLLVVFFLFSPLIREIKELKSGVKSIMKRHLPFDRLEGKQNFEDVFTTTFEALNRRVQQQRELLKIMDQKSHSSDLEQELLPLMRAALAQGASSIRIVLNNEENLFRDSAAQKPFGLGKDTRLYAALDPQIISLVHAEGPITLHDYQIGQHLSLSEDMPYPASFTARPLESSGDWFGVLWIAFTDKWTPGKEDLDFINLLSSRVSSIIAHHAMLEELGSYQQRLTTALDGTSQGILIVDETGKIVYHNPRLREILDLSSRVLVDKDVVNIFRENHLSDLIGNLKRGAVEKEIRLPGGEVIFFRSQSVDIKGQPAGLAMIFEPLRGFKTRLDSSSELVTIVSHAMRSPLTLIHGYAKILRLTGNLNDQQDDYMLKIVNGIEEMRSLVRNLLDIGRIESLGMLDITEFQVSQVLNKIKDSMEAQFRQKNIKFAVSLPEDRLMIQGDFDLLTQAVKSLVDNALKFTKMGGEVSLKVWERDGRVIFSVKDTGTGISPLDQRHLFEKFKPGRGVHGDEASGGGLGLTIVRSIIEHHKGKVWLESQLGKGTTFFIEIPKQQDG